MSSAMLAWWAPSRQFGQPRPRILALALLYFARHDFTGSADSHASSSNVFPLAIAFAALTWQRRMHATRCEKFLTTVSSHLRIFLSNVITVPVSSPPNGTGMLTLAE